MRMQFTVKAQLPKVTTELIARYAEWLYGPKVWGMATLEPDNKPMSTLQVMRFDYQL